MKRSLISIGLLALAAATPAAALTLTFTDRAAWLAQISNLSNFDGGAQPIGTTNYFGRGGLLFTNLQIDGYNTDINNVLTYSIGRVNASPAETYYNWNSGAIIRTIDKNPLSYTNVFARLTFPTPVSAFGFNYGVGGCQTYFVGCTPGAAASITIAPDGLSNIPITTAQGNTMAFWGVISDSQVFGFSDIVINDPNRYIVLDDIAQGTYNSGPPPPSEVAEPGTLIQLAMGAGLLALARRRFQNNQQQAI